MKFEFPYRGEISAMNKGDIYGSLSYSRGIDFSTEKGRILNSPTCLKIINENDLPTLTDPIVAFAVSDSRWYGAGTKVFRNASGTTDPTNTWALDTSTGTPTTTLLESDLVYFNGRLRVSGVNTGDIYELNGTTWSSWWKGVGALNQSALSTGRFVPLKVAPNGRLYILDNANKVYNVTTGGTVTKSGNGTLDFSSTGYVFQCMQMSSTRMWLGGRDGATGMGVVVEWDMSLNEATPNKIYSIEGTGVCNVLIWDDSPVLLLTDGTMRFFDGSSFYRKDGAQLPKAPAGYVYRPDLVRTSFLNLSSFNIHPNGSAVIDGLPHYLMSLTLRDSTDTNVRGQDPKFIAGVFCYDPEIGLYNRFPIEVNGATTGFGANAPISASSITMGALISAPSQKTSFIGSARFNTDGDTRAVIFSDDKARSLASRGFFVLNPFVGTAKDLWEKVEVFATRFKNSSDRILLKYRLGKSPNFPFMATATQTSTTTFTSTDANFANVSQGDWVYITYGSGSGCTAHVSTISYSAPTYTVTLDEATIGYQANSAIEVIVDNFKRLATIDNAKTDYHAPSVPATEGSHTFWLMVELRSSAGSIVELDKIIVTSKDGK